MTSLEKLNPLLSSELLLKNIFTSFWTPFRFPLAWVFTSYRIWDGQLSFPSMLNIVFLLRSQLSVLFLLLYWSDRSSSYRLLLGFSQSWVFSILLWCAFVQYPLCSYYLVPIASRICGLISFIKFRIFFVISSNIVFILFPF